MMAESALAREEWLEFSIALLRQPTGDTEIDAVSTHAAAKAQESLERLRAALPMVACYCRHCGAHFRRSGLIIYLCGRCEDEGHCGSASGCLACADNDHWRAASTAGHVSYGPLAGYPNWKGGLL